MDAIWEELHASRPWGKYPAEPLIRTVMRAYQTPESRANTRVLELGCGAGANLSFFLAEGFQTHGLDGAPSAITNAEDRLRPLVTEGQTFELVVSTFEDIEAKAGSFDLIVDHFAVYANSLAVIVETYAKVREMLVDGGRFYACVWGSETSGADSGKRLEAGTSENPTAGPCKDMGVSHFFSRPEIEEMFRGWADLQITRRVTEEAGGDHIEEFVIWAKK
ncbi:class I SAM-dependent methyltransferase (plasmid) [Roseobacter sp. A03A-229]